LSGSANPASLTMDGNKTVTVTFIQVPPTQYSLTVNTVGSGSVALDPPGGVYNAGTQVTLTATPATGWSFSGWSGDLSGSANPASLTMDGNKTVTAIFIQVPPTQYSLTVNTVGSGSVALDPPGGMYDDGTLVTLTASPAPGWTFDHWEGNVTQYGSDTAKVTMNANETVEAVFLDSSVTYYNLTVIPVGMGSVSYTPPGGIYQEGTAVTLMAISDLGWAFVNWSGDLTETANPVSVTIEADKTIFANFSESGPVYYTVSINTNGGIGSVVFDPQGGTYAAGTEVTLMAIPAVGWKFNSWSGDLESTHNPEKIVLDGNKSITLTLIQVKQVQLLFFPGVLKSPSDWVPFDFARH